MKEGPELDTMMVLQLKAKLIESQNIVIVCHLCPDGDALGSSLGLKRVIAKFKPQAKVTVVTPDEPTRSLSFLYDFDEIKAFSSQPMLVASRLSAADLIICLDFNHPGRIDRVAPLLLNTPGFKLLIDHHIGPENFADLTFSFPNKCSTSLLLFEILEETGLEEYIDKIAANCFLTGILTDTGNLSYSVEDAKVFDSVARLVRHGANKSSLTKQLFQTSSESCLRIQGYALSQRMEVFHDMHAALIVLDREDLNRFGYRKGDTEGLVNKPLEIPGIFYSCLLREETDYIKVSMRSEGNFPVNEVCREYFGGGGHQNAAGGEFHGSMQQCIDTFKNTLETNKKLYLES